MTHHELAQRQGHMPRLKNAVAYSDELAARIARKVAEGETLRNISKEKGYPSLAQLYQWIHRNPEFQTIMNSCLLYTSDAADDYSV